MATYDRQIGGDYWSANAARQRILEQSAPFLRAGREAAAQAQSRASIATLSGATNPALQRDAAAAAAAAQRPFLQQAASMQAQATEAAIQREEQRRRAASDQVGRTVGQVLSAGGQIVGTLMPALAPAGGAASMLGQAIGGQQMGSEAEPQTSPRRRRPPGAIGGSMGSELIDPWAAQRGGY